MTTPGRRAAIEAALVERFAAMLDEWERTKQMIGIRERARRLARAALAEQPRGRCGATIHTDKPSTPDGRRCQLERDHHTPHFAVDVHGARVWQSNDSISYLIEEHPEQPGFHCRLCGEEAAYACLMDKGCACYPHDRVQLLCAQHAQESEPLGSFHSWPIRQATTTSHYEQMVERAAVIETERRRFADDVERRVREREQT